MSVILSGKIEGSVDFPLIPHLTVLRSQLNSRTKPEGFRAVYFQLELLPYSLSSTWMAFRRFNRIQAAIAEHHTAQGMKPQEIVVAHPGDRDQLGFAVDNFLDAARRTQNALIPYVSRALRQRNLPSSMSDLAGKLEDGKIFFPDLLAKTLITYWNNHGRKLKAYRDLSQHFTLVTSECRVFKGSSGPGIYFLLPNNPEARSPGKLQWKPPVHAFHYLKDELYELIRVANVVTKMLTRKGDDLGMVSFVFRNQLELGVGTKLEGCRLPKKGELEEELRTLLSRLAEELTPIWAPEP